MEKYLLVLLVLIFSSFIYLKLAIKYKIIDKPNQRSSHTKVTVRGGGIIFTISVLLFFLMNDYQYPYFFTGVFLISVVSFLDDMVTLSSKIRFPFQLFAVFLILFQVPLPFFPIYIFLFYLLFGIGVVNMFNFMDGINGITGLYSLVVLLGMYFINLDKGIINPDLIIYTALSILVFGFYNFRKKALFFAGDVGSITLGIVIFFIGVFLITKLKSPLILLLIIIYGIDAGNTLLYRRFFTKENIFEPHRHHIYQKMVDVLKISHLKVSVIYSIIQLLMNILVYYYYQSKILIQYTIIGVSLLFFSGLYFLVFKKIKIKSLINSGI